MPRGFSHQGITNIMRKHYQNIAEILKQENTGLNKILSKTLELQRLQQMVIPELPEELQPHCQVASWDNGQLSLVADSNVWATRLRYATGELLSNLRVKHQLYNLKNIHCKVRLSPHEQLKPTTPVKPGIISQSRLRILQQEATAIENSPVRDALIRLLVLNSKS